MTATTEPDRIVREPECKKRSGLSRTTRWRLEREGKFPKRVKITEFSHGWLDSKLNKWIVERASLSDASATAGHEATAQAQEAELTAQAPPQVAAPQPANLTSLPRRRSKARAREPEPAGAE
jgi:prophage regulatory protein